MYPEDDFPNIMSVYNPDTDKWEDDTDALCPPVDGKPNCLHGFGAVQLGGLLYILRASCYGCRCDGACETWIYDDASKQWSKGPQYGGDHIDGMHTLGAYDKRVYVLQGKNVK